VALTVSKISTWSELERLRSVWESLLRESSGPTIFSTPEWLGAWWRAFANGNELVILVFHNAVNEIVGLAPFYKDRVSGPLSFSVRRLRLVGDGSGDSDNLDLIVRQGCEGSYVQALLAWLTAEPGWDVCELNTLPLDSSSLTAMVHELKARRWKFRQLETPRSTISLPEKWEDYLGQISKKEKTKINYYTNRLKRRFEVGFSRCTDDNELQACLDKLFELHQKRWELRREPGSFASTARREFYYDMARSFLKQRWLEFWQLKLDGKTVAAQFGFRYRDAVYSLQEGFDPGLSSDRVGYVLRAQALRTLISEGVHHYDFLGGENPSKDRWGAQIGHYIDIHFARPRSRGAAFLRLDGAARWAKDWLKSNLPTAAIGAARRVYHAARGTSDAGQKMGGAGNGQTPFEPKG
jgi:CelD/BcsL family acetyltransferase involved in cellulose biosynthesis